MGSIIVMERIPNHHVQPQPSGNAQMCRTTALPVCNHMSVIFQQKLVQVTLTSTVFKLHLVFLFTLIVLVQELPQSLRVRQEGLHGSGVEGHLSFI